MLLTKEVEVKLSNRNIGHYRSKEYECKSGEVITVKVEDLSNGSQVKVDVLCDYCKTKVLHIPYHEYKRKIDSAETCACSKCRFIKKRETNIKKYGVEYTFQREDVKSKIRETNLKKYGVENPMQSNEIKEKLKNTIMELYGVDNYAKTKECQEKKKVTNLEKYGFGCSFQNEDVKAKYRESCMEKYGATNPMKLKEVQEKIRQTLIEKYGTPNTWKVGQIDNPFDDIKVILANRAYESGKINTSKQQRYLHNLYGGILNYPISYFFADICFPDEKIDIEYNGGGHNLDIKTGRLTQEQHNKREYYRGITIKTEGYKVMTIISSKDYLPSDTILLEMLEQARTYFTTTSHTWIEYNIDTSTMRNAENKDGIYFDYGDLRKIKEAS